MNNNSENDIMRCVNCGQELYQDEKFCRNCGTKIERQAETDTMICRNCGGVVKKGLFCIQCGHKAENEPTVELASISTNEINGMNSRAGVINTSALLDRAYIALADKEWGAAYNFCEQVLNQEPQCADAYIVQLLSALKCGCRSDLSKLDKPFDDLLSYKKAIRFADETSQNELIGYNNIIRERNILEAAEEEKRLTDKKNEELYLEACSLIIDNENALKKAQDLFINLGNYKDSSNKADECINRLEVLRKNTVYTDACRDLINGTTDSVQYAMKSFESIIDWKDSAAKIDECKNKLARIEELQYESEQAECELADSFKKKKIIKFSLIAVGIIVILVPVLLLVLPAVSRSKEKKSEQTKYTDDAETIRNAYNDYLFPENRRNTDEIPNLKENQDPEATYQTAIDMVKAGRMKEAASLLRTIEDYKDSRLYTFCYENNLDVYFENGYPVISYGKYYQWYYDGDFRYDPIEWYVIDIEKEENLGPEYTTAVLLSKYILDYFPYEQIIDFSWEQQLDEWLHFFIRHSFEDSFEDTLVRQINLLPVDDVNNLSDEILIAEATSYAMENGVKSTTGRYAWFLAETPTHTTNDFGKFAYYNSVINPMDFDLIGKIRNAGEDGDVWSEYGNKVYAGIRPQIKLLLNNVPDWRFQNKPGDEHNYIDLPYGADNLLELKDIAEIDSFEIVDEVDKDGRKWYKYEFSIEGEKYSGYSRYNYMEFFGFYPMNDVSDALTDSELFSDPYENDEESITDEAEGKYMGIVTGTVNVRSGPGTDYDMLLDKNGDAIQLTSNHEVYIIDEQKDKTGQLYYKIQFEKEGDKYEGYSTSTYIVNTKAKVVLEFTDGTKKTWQTGDSKIKLGKKTLAYVYFGEYPQTEVTGKKLTKEIKNARYDKNGIATVKGVKYKRIKREDATSAFDSSENNYAWAGKTYAYFRLEPIKWRVLSNKKGTVLLMSEYGLDDRQYNFEYVDITWADCTLRSWLNSDFLASAFNAKERKLIKTTKVKNNDNPYYGTEGGKDTKDKVFLLSLEEIVNTKYGFASDRYEPDISRRCSSTDFAKAMGAYTAYSEGDWADELLKTKEGKWTSGWWLRSPGRLSVYAAGVSDGGYVDDYGSLVDYVVIAVRPALQLNLSSVIG